MKIVFICSSLEHGRDGVGDYTIKLASELIRQGHIAVAIALNDKYITEELDDTIRKLDNIDLPVLRLPSIWPIAKRNDYAKRYINNFIPDILSLQFVIFGYHSKGLPFSIAKQLAFIGNGRPWQIMFHELWIGITKKSPLKHKGYGFFQKGIIKSIIKTLKPKVINTSNGLHHALLNSVGINSVILPLFSNIPIAPLEADFLKTVDSKLGFSFEESLQYVIIGIFGNLHPQAKLDDVINEELVLAKNDNKNLVFISVGRIGDEGLKELERLTKAFDGLVKFFQFGEQSEKNVSMLLQVMNKGISCTPIEHIGKSGVYAAMRHHGLSVITPVSDYIPEYDIEIKEFNEQLLKKESYLWSVNYVAKSFLNLIGQ
jgi:hypothetical protein